MMRLPMNIGDPAPDVDLPCLDVEIEVEKFGDRRNIVLLTAGS